MQILGGVYGSEHRQCDTVVSKVCKCVQVVGCVCGLLVLEWTGLSADAEGRRVINLLGLWFRMKG